MRTAVRGALWVLFGLFFLFPLYAMADFSTRNLLSGGRTGQAWANLITDEALTASVGHNGYFTPHSESLRNMALIGIDRGSLVATGSSEDVQRTLAYFDRLI